MASDVQNGVGGKSCCHGDPSSVLGETSVSQLGAAGIRVGDTRVVLRCPVCPLPAKWQQDSVQATAHSVSQASVENSQDDLYAGFRHTVEGAIPESCKSHIRSSPQCLPAHSVYQGLRLLIC